MDRAPILSNNDYVRLLEIDISRMSSVVPENLSIDINHIEGWTVQSVIGHTGWTARYAAESLKADPNTRPPRSAVPEPPAGADVIDWFTAAAAELSHAFETADLDKLRPTWTGPQPGHWWLRRICHEVAIHRWDVFSSLTSPEPIEQSQSVDAINELLEVFMPNRMALDKLDSSGKSIHLHATDIDNGEWLIAIDEDKIVWSLEHAKATVAAKGAVSDLLLLLWGRLPPSRLEVFGEPDLLTKWQTSSNF